MYLGFQIFYKVFKCMGEDGFIIFWTKKCHFLRAYREAEKPPRNLTYIFDPVSNRYNTCYYLILIDCTLKKYQTKPFPWTANIKWMFFPNLCDRHKFLTKSSLLIPFLKFSFLIKVFIHGVMGNLHFWIMRTSKNSL